MICILLFHEKFMPGPFFESIRHWGHLGVDVFLFLSGYGIAHSLNRNSLGKYYYNRIVRMFPSCLMWGTMALLVSLFIDRTFPPLRYYVLTPLCLDKWFIYAIVLFYAISPFLFRLAKCNAFFFLTAAYCISLFNGCYKLYEWWPLNWTLDRFPVYCVGMAMSFLKDSKIDWKILLVSGLFLFHLVFKIIPGPQVSLYLFFIPTIPILFILSHYVKIALSSISIAKFVEWMGVNSLEIYLTHELVFREISKLEMNSYLQFLLAIVLTFVLAYTTGKILPLLQRQLSKILCRFVLVK